MTGPSFEGSFEFVEHTADIAVRLRAPTLAALFGAAAAALTEAVTNGGTVRAGEERQVRLSASDLDLLLVDWLHELLFLFETEAFLVGQAEIQITYGGTKITKDMRITEEGPPPSAEGLKEDHRDRRGPRALRDEYVIAALVRGEHRDPERHPLKVLVKAVTYHGLQITRSNHGFEATIIFDI